MSVALLVSLVLALSFTPALAAAVEPAASAPRRCKGLVIDWRRGWRASIRAGCAGCSRMRGWRSVAGAMFLAIAWVAYDHVETGFVPVMDEGAFVLDYWAPAGTSLQETTRMLRQVDAILEQTPEVAAFSRRTGAELGFFLTESNRGDYAVRLRRGARRRIDDIMDGGARPDSRESAGAARRLRADLAGHDRRPQRQSEPGRDQAVRPATKASCCGPHRPSMRSLPACPASSTASTASRRSGRRTGSTSMSNVPTSSASMRRRCSTGWRRRSPARWSVRCWRATARFRCACATPIAFATGSTASTS